MKEYSRNWKRPQVYKDLDNAEEARENTMKRELFPRK